MVNEAYGSIPNPDFSPKGRRLEHALVKEAIRAIRESNAFTENEKSKIIGFWNNYLLEYEHLYNRKMEEKFFQNIEKNLRETDLLKKDALADEGWRRYCIKKNLRRQKILN